jgi:hypothetical protein
MLVREIWKCIHPWVWYWYLWVNKFSYFLNLHAINVLLYQMKLRKHIHVKYCYFKSIETLSQTFKKHFSHYYGVLTPLNQWWKNL